MAKPKPKSARMTVSFGNQNYRISVPGTAYPSSVANKLGLKPWKVGTPYTEGRSMRPPRVNIRTANGRSYVRFCSPSHLAKLVIDKHYNGFKINNSQVISVTVKSD